jgi:hypothetical protein
VSSTVDGASGSITANTSLSVAVTAQPVQFPFQATGGWLVHGFSDEARQLLFATNPELNELDVISGVDLSIKARVPLPSAWGIDQMADGKTLVIGTAAQEIFTVDEDTLTVTRFPGPSYSVFDTFYPNPIAMANGKVLLIGQEQGVDSNDILDGGQFLIEWDTVANTFTQLEPQAGATPLWETDSLARSADNKWAVFADDGASLYLYSSDADSWISVPVSSLGPSSSAISINAYALNADGSMVAVVSGGEILFLDQSLNVTSSIPISSSALTVPLASVVRFSADGSRLIMGSGASVLTVDTNNGSAIGYYSGVGLPSDPVGRFLTASSSGVAFFGTEGGVSTANTTLPPVVVSAGGNEPSGAACAFPYPFYFPLNTSVQVPFQGNEAVATGTKVYLGNNEATLSTNIQDAVNLIDIPASSVTGPVNLECIDSGGDTTIIPSAISYGVEPIASSANFLPATGNPSIILYGYGILDAPYNSIPAVTIGGSPATVLSTNSDLFVGSLQGVTVQAPSGTAGQTSGIAVSNANGAGTFASAVTYIPSTTIVPASGILQLLYDTHRNLLYALKANQVAVLNPATLQWQSSLQLPASTATINFAMMALSPDGTKMVLASETGNLVVLNPDQPAQASVLSYKGNFSSVGISQFNQAFFVDNSSSPLVMVDLASLTITPLGTGFDLIRASADGSHLFGADLSVSSGQVFSVDPATFAMQTQGFGQLFWTDLAVSPDGSQFAAIYEVPGADGDLIGLFDSSLHYSNSNELPLLSPPSDSGVVGATYSPQSSVLVMPLGDSIEFWDAAQGTLRARLMTPEELNIIQFPQFSIVPQIALDATGQTVYAISASGLTVLKLPTTVDQMPTVHWPLAVHATGTQPGLHGSMAKRMAAMRSQIKRVNHPQR